MGSVAIDVGDKIRRIKGNLESPKVALNQIGDIMVAESQRAFKDQAFGGKAWPARRVPNIFGILADFAAGQTPPKRRWDARPALINEGATGLLGSIGKALVGNDAVEVGTNRAYASVHQNGGEVESAKITKGMQEAMWEWLKKQGKPIKRQLGWLLNKKFTGKTLKGKVPKRQFVGVTKRTREEIRETIGVKIMEVER